MAPLCEMTVVPWYRSSSRSRMIELPMTRSPFVVVLSRWCSSFIRSDLSIASDCSRSSSLLRHVLSSCLLFCNCCSKSLFLSVKAASLSCSSSFSCEIFAVWSIFVERSVSAAKRLSGRRGALECWSLLWFWCDCSFGWAWEPVGWRGRAACWGGGIWCWGAVAETSALALARNVVSPMDHWREPSLRSSSGSCSPPSIWVSLFWVGGWSGVSVSRSWLVTSCPDCSCCPLLLSSSVSVNDGELLKGEGCCIKSWLRGVIGVGKNRLFDRKLWGVVVIGQLFHCVEDHIGSSKLSRTNVCTPNIVDKDIAQRYWTTTTHFNNKRQFWLYK